MTPNTASHQIKPLTGIRGLAALYVVLWHVPIFAPWQPRLLQHGYMGVDLFFILSGFVMAMSYSELFTESFSLRHYVAFLIRRLARVYPLYLMVVCIYGFAMMAHLIDDNGFPLTWRRFLTNVLMIQAWGLTASILGPLWSISTEWAVYLVFPILAAGLLFSRPQVASILGACMLTVLIGLALAPTPSPTFSRAGPLDIWWTGSLWPLIRCLTEFSLGLAAFRVADCTDVRAIVGHQAFALAVSAVILVLLALPKSDLAVVVLLPSLIISMTLGRGPVQAFLGWQPVFILGELSYAIYLLHPRLTKLWYPLTTFLTRFIGMEAAWRVSFFVVLIASAWLAHELIEKPCRRAVRKLENLLGRDERKAVLASEMAGQNKFS